MAVVTRGTSALYLSLGYAYGPVFLNVVFGLYWAVQSGRRMAAFVVAGLGYISYVVASVIDPFPTASTPSVLPSSPAGLR